MLRHLLGRIGHQPLPEGKKTAFHNSMTLHTVSGASGEWLVTQLLLGRINALPSRAARKSPPPLSLLNDRTP